MMSKRHTKSTGRNSHHRGANSAPQKNGKKHQQNANKGDPASYTGIYLNRQRAHQVLVESFFSKGMIEITITRSEVK